MSIVAEDKAERKAKEEQHPEHIPPVSPLPQGSRMPRASIGNFVGREKELRELARSLTPGSSVARDTYNIGGILKAQGDLAGALEYSRHALKIAEKVYGSDNPTTKIYAANLRGLQQSGDGFNF